LDCQFFGAFFVYVASDSLLFPYNVTDLGLPPISEANYPPSIQPNTKNTAAPVEPDIKLLARLVALRIIDDGKDRPHLRSLFLSELDRALDNDYNDSS
jgi:hypothetical protein